MIVNLTSSQCSYSADAVLTTDYAQDTIVQGHGFVFEKNFAIASGGTLYILFDYTTYTPAEGQAGIVYILPPFFSTTAGPVSVTVYRGTNYTGGTAIPVLNPNTMAAKTAAGTTVSFGATGSTKGTVALEYLVGGASQGNQSASGSAAGLSFFIRPNTSKTLVEVVNNSGQSITFHNAQLLFEI